MSNKRVSDEALVESYGRLNNIWKVAKEVGLCGQSVQERLVRLGIKRNNPKFTDAEIQHLKANYTTYLLNGNLHQLATEMGRTKPLICRKAKSIGLTDVKRKKSTILNFKPNMPDWVNNPHPRGMAGKKHSKETIERLCITSREMQANISLDPVKRASISRKQIETKIIRGNLVSERQKTTWKGGWRVVGGVNKYYRSRWEANYAMYLQYQKEGGMITDWKHEPKVFLFNGINGCTSFLPDFEIITTDGSTIYHEVKGWMDSRSISKIKAMEICYPEVNLTIINEKWFKDNSKELSNKIKSWEK